MALGRNIAEHLPQGGFAALIGALGAGKTVFVRGMAAGLGVRHLSSPTFTIVQEYDTAPPLYHFDVYRLADVWELEAIGYADYLSRGALVVMEWADLMPEALPSERLEVCVEGSGEVPRTLTLTAYGDAYEQIILNLERNV